MLFATDCVFGSLEKKFGKLDTPEPSSDDAMLAPGWIMSPFSALRRNKTNTTEHGERGRG
jgi:hypothetical protein